MPTPEHQVSLPDQAELRSYGFGMSAVTRPLGPLPPRVYWTRRLLLVAVLFALVFGLARLLGGGGGGGPSAQPVAAESSAPTSSTTTPVSSPAAIGTAATVSSSPSPTSTVSPTGKGAGKNAKSTALPEPTGTCSVSDIVVTPSIKDQAHAGKPVTFAMQLSTKSTPACTFDVAPDSLVVKITSGSDRIWSTQDCPKAVPTKSVVLRKGTPTTVDVTWSAMRSDSDCSKTTQWAQAGYYHALAAVFGAEPVDEQFELMKPVRPTITAKPSPTGKAKDGSDKTSTKKSTKQPSSKPSTSKPAGKPSSKPSKKAG
jgi:hypothetical protein